jgi:hypothetical protein
MATGGRISGTAHGGITESIRSERYHGSSSSSSSADFNRDFTRNTLLNKQHSGGSSAFSIGRTSTRRRAAGGTLTEDPPATSITLLDVATVAAVTGGVVAVQKKNRRAHLEASGGASSLNNPAVSSLQLSFFCSRGEEDSRTILDELRSLASHADASTPAGLRAIVRESAVAALRAEDDWLGVSGGVQQFAGNGGGKAASTFVS